MNLVNSQNQKRTKFNLATLATAVFSVVGIIAIFSLEKISADTLVIIVFYAILVFNTHFSIKCFKPITPREFRHYFIDTILVGLYLYLPFSFADPLKFVMITAFIFNLALVKYSILLKDTKHPKLLKRKVYIDGLGLLSCLLCFVGYLWSASNVLILLAWTAIFLVANIYLFLVRPLYIHDFEN